jgi:hypothetical protein
VYPRKHPRYIPGEPNGTWRQCPTSPLLSLASAGTAANTSSTVSGARGSTTGPPPSSRRDLGLRPRLRAGLDPPPADPPLRRHQPGEAPPVCPRPAEGLSRMPRPPAVLVRPAPGRTRPDRQGCCQAPVAGQPLALSRRARLTESELSSPGSSPSSAHEFVSIPDAKSTIDGRR